MMDELKRYMVPLMLGVFLSSGTSALAYTGQEFESEAKVTLKDAEAIALKSVPGKITDEELEREAGGSGLRYSFDILLKAATYEVGVDAKTGKVLERSVEGRHPD